VCCCASVCSAVAAELLGKCGMKDNEIFVKELDAYMHLDGEDRTSDVRSHASNFLEKFVTSFANITSSVR